MSEMAAAVLDEELQEDEVLILDDLSAELEIQKIKEAEAECERSCAWYEEMIRRAQAKRDHIRETAERNLRSFFEMPGLPRKAAKTQVSYELRTGKLVLKTQEPEYDRQEDQLCKWLKDNGKAGMVKTKESADWKELKKELKVGPDGKCMVTADGEIVPGITVIEREPKFSVSVK